MIVLRLISLPEDWADATRHNQSGEKDLDDFVALISGFAAHL
jgi:hypothetical protein